MVSSKSDQHSQHFDTVWEDMRTNLRRARFQIARADRGGQKSEGKGKQVTREGTSNKRKRSEDSSNEDGDSSDGSSSSDSSCDSDSDGTE